MPELQTYEPGKPIAGVTRKLKKTSSDDPANEWTLTYYPRKSGTTASGFSKKIS